MANVSLRSVSHGRPRVCLVAQHLLLKVTYIDLGILKAFLQVVIDRLIRNLANQCKIRNPHLFLLSSLKDCLSDLRLRSSGWRRGGRGLFTPTGALGNGLVLVLALLHAPCMCSEMYLAMSLVP